jgi:acetyltransferase-like isoleucine patch superfamily enzyme
MRSKIRYNLFAKVLNFFIKKARYYLKIAGRIPIFLKLYYHHVDFNKTIRGNRFYINNQGKIILGNNVYLHSYPEGTSFKTALSTYFSDAVIKIGNNCSLNGTVLQCNERIEIGDYTMIAPGTVIIDNNSHRISKDHLERRKKSDSKPIIIKDNVWIGLNCLILKGVTIGENSIIAAGSIVIKDVPDNCLHGGAPARLIRKLES